MKDAIATIWMFCIFIAFLAALWLCGLLEFSDAKDRAIGSGYEAEVVK